MDGPGADHVGVHIMDVLDASNADCRCARCEWLRARNATTGAIPDYVMDDTPTQCARCCASIPCNCPKKGTP